MGEELYDEDYGLFPSTFLTICISFYQIWIKAFTFLGSPPFYSLPF